MAMCWRSKTGVGRHTVPSDHPLAGMGRRWFCVLIAMWGVLCPAVAAPMFPDVPDQWAREAVASLAARGLLEGYPDGTFKGDRAATRYEVALLVARLLSREESAHATLASRDDLRALRTLAQQVRDELDALGIRVERLEDNVSRLEARVTELERITFYGSLDARFVSMQMRNRGLAEGNNSAQNTTVVAPPGGVPYNIASGGAYPNVLGVDLPPAVGAVVSTPSSLAALAALMPTVSAFALPGAPGLVLINNPFAGGAPPGSLVVPGTSGPTAPVAGLGGQSIALTGVGVPAAFIAGSAPGLPAGLAGRAVFVNEFAANASGYYSPAVSGTQPSYNLVVGSTASLGAGNPFTGLTGQVGVAPTVPLVLPTFDLQNGRPWTEGTGVSGQGILGVRIMLNPDMDAGAEFAAWSGSGDAVVNAFYGAWAARRSNPFTSTDSVGVLDAGQTGLNSPWTRMTLDKFWLLYKPANIRLQLGSYGESKMDPMIYQPQADPSLFGPRFLDNYGFRISGQQRLFVPFEWEVFGSAAADAAHLSDYPTAATVGAAPYQPYLWGIDGRWTIGEEGNQARIKFNLLRIWDDGASSQATTVGSIVGINGVWTDWANPNGYYAAQLAPQYVNNATGTTLNPNAARVAGFGSTSDARPVIPNIAGNGGGLGSPGGLPVAPALGVDQTGSGRFGAATEPFLLALGAPVDSGAPTSSFGPQSMFTWGLSAAWDYRATDDLAVRLFGEFGASRYKPSANSPYVAPAGKAARVALGFTFFQDFDLDTEYLDVNPYYNPFILQFPDVNGLTQALWRVPSLSWFPELYPVSDKEVYPNNRSGLRISLKWSPQDSKDGRHRTIFSGEYARMAQDQTSLQQIRYSPGSISVGNMIVGTGSGGVPALFDPNSTIPNGFVLGQNPGFIDTVFTGYSPSSFAGYTGSYAPSAVNQFARPLEDPRGHVTNWGLGASYRFDRLGGLWLRAQYRNWWFNRPSSLAPAYGGSENTVDLHLDGGIVSLSYPVSERFSLKAGYAWAGVVGHYDPMGIYRNFALDVGATNFRTVDQTQTSPFAGFDYDVARNVDFNLTAKWINSHDNLGTFQTPTFFLQRNPFSWSGLQLTSQVKATF